LAGGQGRAIYNDVDQIYLADPGQLFDLEMGEHGFLSITPRETSVMLLDCARMTGVAGRGRATGAAQAPRGSRDPSMGTTRCVRNARDDSTSPDNRSFCTTRRSTPSRGGRFRATTYQPSRFADVWLELEREKPTRPATTVLLRPAEHHLSGRARSTAGRTAPDLHGASTFPKAQPTCAETCVS
jgi:hypothetical protein